MALTPFNLVEPHKIRPDRLVQFVSKLKAAANDVDLSSTGISRMSIEANATERWMQVKFHCRSAAHEFSGPLLSADLLVPGSSFLQFQPRLLLAESGSGMVLADEAGMVAVWRALTKALERVAALAASRV